MSGFVAKLRIKGSSFVKSIPLILASTSVGYIFFSQNTWLCMVNGSSMVPTFRHGDWLLVWKTQNVKRGDLVALKSANVYQQRALKRIIGMPGDVLWIDNGGVADVQNPTQAYELEMDTSPGIGRWKLYANPLEFSSFSEKKFTYVPKNLRSETQQTEAIQKTQTQSRDSKQQTEIITTSSFEKNKNFQQIKLPWNYIWVEGDNSPVSLDSRYYGPTSKSTVMGKVIFGFRKQQSWPWLYVPSVVAWDDSRHLYLKDRIVSSILKW